MADPARRALPAHRRLAGLGALLLAPLASGGAAAPQELQEAPSPLAARGRGGLTVTVAELNAVLLERYALAPEGREMLDLLIGTSIIDELADEAGIEISNAEITRLWDFLDQQARAAGDPGGILSEIRSRGLPPEDFRDFLRLSLLQQQLTRRALDLDPKIEVSGDQQEVWLKQEIASRKLELIPPPWDDGVIARCGNATVLANDLAATLRGQLPRDEVQEACWHILLLKGIEERMPDLASEALERGIDREIERRRTRHRLEYPAISFEQRLGAAGRTMDQLRGDPSVMIATLSRLWVDQTAGAEGLREAYEGERAWFEGRYGKAVRTHVLFLVAGRFVNDLNRRNFKMAEEELLELSARIGNLDDFMAISAERSEEASIREKRGALGWVAREDPGVPPSIREAVFEHVDTGGSIPPEGTAVGPVRLDTGCGLLWVSGVREPPGWEQMSVYVHEELRRRFLEGIMRPSDVEILLYE